MFIMRIHKSIKRDSHQRTYLFNSYKVTSLDIIFELDSVIYDRGAGWSMVAKLSKTRLT